MGIFKRYRTRDIVFCTISALIVIGGIVTLCVLLWQKEEKTVEQPKSTNITTSYETPQPNADGHYYTIVPCEEVAAITGDDCSSSSSTQDYTNSYTYSYTPSETTHNTAPTTPQYNIPDYTPTPAPTPTCADYHAQYYAEYQSQLSSTNSHYTSAINTAVASCSSQHGSFGGCPQKTSLEQQWQAAVTQVKNSYKSNMSSAGCDPSAYVDF